MYKPSRLITSILLVAQLSAPSVYASPKTSTSSYKPLAILAGLLTWFSTLASAQQNSKAIVSGSGTMQNSSNHVVLNPDMSRLIQLEKEKDAFEKQIAALAETGTHSKSQAKMRTNDFPKEVSIPFQNLDVSVRLQDGGHELFVDLFEGEERADDYAIKLDLELVDYQIEALDNNLLNITWSGKDDHGKLRFQNQVMQLVDTEHGVSLQKTGNIQNLFFSMLSHVWQDGDRVFAQFSDANGDKVGEKLFIAQVDGKLISHEANWSQQGQLMVSLNIKTKEGTRTTQHTIKQPLSHLKQIDKSEVGLAIQSSRRSLASDNTRRVNAGWLFGFGLTANTIGFIGTFFSGFMFYNNVSIKKITMANSVFAISGLALNMLGVLISPNSFKDTARGAVISSFVLTMPTLFALCFSIKDDANTDSNQKLIIDKPNIAFGNIANSNEKLIIIERSRGLVNLVKSHNHSCADSLKKAIDSPDKSDCISKIKDQCDSIISGCTAPAKNNMHKTLAREIKMLCQKFIDHR